MRAQQSRVGGFSLIELLIVISLMMVLLGGGFAGYARFSQQKKWEVDIEAVTTLVQSGVSRTALRDVSSQSCATFDGYQISIDSSTQTIILSLSCPTKIEIMRYVLQHAQFTASNPKTTQISYPYGSLSSPVTITVKNAYGSECQPISVSVQGVITLLKRISC